eukprot:1950186-Rhodomonas_salina.1
MDRETERQRDRRLNRETDKQTDTRSMMSVSGATSGCRLGAAVLCSLPQPQVRLRQGRCHRLTCHAVPALRLRLGFI